MVVIGTKQSVIDGTMVSADTNVFYDLYTQQKQAVWFAEEINIQTDMKDYQSLSDAERDLFHDLVGYFVTSELLVQNVLGDSFLPYVVDPRARMAMVAQMFMEGIHEDYMESVLNTFGIDRDAMYAKAQTDPLMRKKQQLVARSADSIADVDADSLSGKKQILKAILINNIVQEGIFFYSAFALYFSMRETNKMKMVNNGIDLVLIDESFHLKLGVELILAILEENPEIGEDYAFVQEIQNTIVEGVEIELEYLQSKFQQHTIFGVSYREMEEYLKYIADRRLEELGLPPHYEVTENPMSFLEKQDMMTLQNFFETTPINYTNF